MASSLDFTEPSGHFTNEEAILWYYTGVKLPFTTHMLYI